MKGPGRPRKDEEPETIANVSFKADAETVAALDLVIARMKPVGSSRNSKSTVIRRLILDAARDLASFDEAIGATPEAKAEVAVKAVGRLKKSRKSLLDKG